MKLMDKRRFFFLFFVACFIACDKKPGNGTTPEPNPPVDPASVFTNPLLPSGPDPWIAQKDNIYYYTHTLGNRIDIWKTAKVSDLNKAMPKTVWTAPATGLNSNNIWAPEFHFIENKWYTYYTAGSTPNHNSQRSFVLENTSADPTVGSWTDKGQIKDPAADFFAIDGTVFSYNGSNYFIYSGYPSATNTTQNLYIARMANPWTLETGRTLISSPSLIWETQGAPVNEGPEILKSSTGRVFLIYSASGCWTDDYALGMLTLKEGGNPLNATDWTKNPTPVFIKKPSTSTYGPGHNTFFKSKDGTEDWILYHANNAPRQGNGCDDARNPRMQKFTWNADGTPNFGEPLPINTSIKKPSGE